MKTTKPTNYQPPCPSSIRISGKNKEKEPVDMDLTLMLSLDTALNLILRSLEGFPELPREKQAELLWEYTNLVFKYPKTDMFFSFWQEAAYCDVRDALNVEIISERSLG